MTPKKKVSNSMGEAVKGLFSDKESSKEQRLAEALTKFLALQSVEGKALLNEQMEALKKAGNISGVDSVEQLLKALSQPRYQNTLNALMAGKKIASGTKENFASKILEATQKVEGAGVSLLGSVSPVLTGIHDALQAGSLSAKEVQALSERALDIVSGNKNLSKDLFELVQVLTKGLEADKMDKEQQKLFVAEVAQEVQKMAKSAVKGVVEVSKDADAANKKRQDQAAQELKRIRERELPEAGSRKSQPGETWGAKAFFETIRYSKLGNIAKFLNLEEHLSKTPEERAAATKERIDRIPDTPEGRIEKHKEAIKAWAVQAVMGFWPVKKMVEMLASLLALPTKIGTSVSKGVERVLGPVDFDEKTGKWSRKVKRKEEDPQQLGPTRRDLLAEQSRASRAFRGERESPSRGGVSNVLNLIPGAGILSSAVKGIGSLIGGVSMGAAGLVGAAGAAGAGVGLAIDKIGMRGPNRKLDESYQDRQWQQEQQASNPKLVALKRINEKLRNMRHAKAVNPTMGYRYDETIKSLEQQRKDILSGSEATAVPAPIEKTDLSKALNNSPQVEVQTPPVVVNVPPAPTPPMQRITHIEDMGTFMSASGFIA